MKSQPKIHSLTAAILFFTIAAILTFHTPGVVLTRPESVRFYEYISHNWTHFSLFLENFYNKKIYLYNLFIVNLFNTILTDL